MLPSAIPVVTLLQLNSYTASATVARCSSADGIAEDPYEPGQAVGVGIKAEMWKTNHPNLTILETEKDTPVVVCVHVLADSCGWYV